jgi:hypothetical protein
LQENIAKAVVSADTLSPDGIQNRLEELQKELIKKANNKQDYDAIADEIFRLREQKEKAEVDSHCREEAMNRIKELQDFIASRKPRSQNLTRLWSESSSRRSPSSPTTSRWNSNPALRLILRDKSTDAETPPSRYGSKVFLSLCRSPPPMMAVWEPWCAFILSFSCIDSWR